MPFDADDEKFLHNQISDAVENMLQAVVMQANYRNEIKISESADFNFGWAIGFVERGFSLYYFRKHGKGPTDEDESNILKEIQKRLHEIRDASNY